MVTTKFTGGKFSRHLMATLAAGALVGLSGQAAMAKETKSFVISWFLQAAYSYDGHCPDGLNPLPEEGFRLQLRHIGTSEARIEEILAGLKGGSSTPETRSALINRGRIDGKPVNVYTYPTSTVDLGFHEVKGKLAYGFNLDGKETANNYEDPDTHETGVDNQYWRAMGCNINHQGSRTVTPSEWSLHWDNERDKMPAWLLSITGEDLSKDGDVTVTFQKALEHVSRDANGYVRADSTFRIDPDPRWQNHLKGKIKDGVISVTEPGDVHLSGDPYHLTELDMSNAHFRMTLDATGTGEGVLGGYIPWRRVSYIYGSSGYNMETMLGTNIPSSYYALRRHADAYPDPKTGENTAISSSFRVVALPAFAVAVEPGLE